MTAPCIILAILLSPACQTMKVKKQDFVKNLICFFSVDPISIDGKLDEQEWKYAKKISIEDDSLRSENKAVCMVLWNEENLYIAFDVRDKDLQAKQTIRDHPQLSRDDIVEFLIDSRNDKDSCWTTDDVIYHINLFGQTKDDRGTLDCRSDSKWNGEAKIAVQLSGTLNDSSDIDTGYTVEVAVPWKELGRTPINGLIMGINFANADSGIFFDWAGAWPFRSPYAFGNLILKK